MCKLNNIKDKPFLVYYMPDDNYIGVTTNIKKRMLKHRSRNGFTIDNYVVLHEFDNLNEALNCELELQKKYNCKKGVRNQEGIKNPYAKMCLHTTTGIYYDTIKDACETLGINYSSMRHLIRNENNKHNLVRV